MNTPMHATNEQLEELYEQREQLSDNDNDKMAAIDALLELLGWRTVVHMLPERVRTLRYYHTPGRPGSLGLIFNLREDFQPSITPWYWKPALYDALKMGGRL